VNAHDIETLIADALNIAAATADEDPSAEVPDGIEELNAIRTYAEAGVLTDNAGLVLHLDDGSEFQVTIAQSR